MLARRLGLKFMDTDELIERETGLRIKDIFKRYGEGRFRDLERKVIKDIASGRYGCGMVLSTGGGAVVDEANRRALRSWGTVVCLTASVEKILERVEGSDERPLLEDRERKGRIEKLLRERDGAYRDSDMVIDTTSMSIEDVVEEILGRLSE